MQSQFVEKFYLNINNYIQTAIAIFLSNVNKCDDCENLSTYLHHSFLNSNESAQLLLYIHPVQVGDKAGISF